MQTQYTATVESAYEKLLQAYKNKISIAPLTSNFPDLSIEEAYQIQMKFIEEKVKEGQKVVGKKIGLTSEAMQDLLGVDQPDYGHLLDAMQLNEGEPIPLLYLFQPKVEAEIAFILESDLKGPDVTVEAVMNATAYVVPSLEIVDSRIQDWKITLPDTIADNASSGMFIIGGKKVKPQEVNLTDIRMQLFKNGDFVNEGTGADVLGDPAACVAWLANKLSDYGVTLKAGEVILSGALSAAVKVEKGDKITASFTSLGDLESEVK
ncbi:2-keto-4-pentenoate hydratase [Pseudalkalibacillus sp. A8]|uniref:2-keto-4-pentenoate hydratase n=1 Tax=Pseudalkalibacillus sp. A8 TaxID=3382641 RepID=UPI0038B595AB